jgi:hypothetical protein
MTNFVREKEYRKADSTVKNEKSIFHENNQKSKIENPKSKIASTWMGGRYVSVLSNDALKHILCS